MLADIPRETMSGEPGTRKVAGRRDRKSVVLDTMLVFTLDFRSTILYTDSAWQPATKTRTTRAYYTGGPKLEPPPWGRAHRAGIGKVYGGFLQNARIVKNFLTLLQKTAGPIPTPELPSGCGETP